MAEFMTEFTDFLSYLSLVAGSSALGYFLGAEGSISTAEMSLSPSVHLVFSPSVGTAATNTPPLDVSDYNVANIILGVSMFFLMILLMVKSDVKDVSRYVIPFMITVGAMCMGIILGYRNQIITGSMNIYWAVMGLLGGAIFLSVVTFVAKNNGVGKTSSSSSSSSYSWMWGFITLIFASGAGLLTYLSAGDDTLLPGTDKKFLDIAMAGSWVATLFSAGMVWYSRNNDQTATFVALTPTPTGSSYSESSYSRTPSESNESVFGPPSTNPFE